METDPGDVTLATYEAGARMYRDDENRRPRPTQVESFLSGLARLLPGPGRRVLELGSGTGADASYLEALGVTVVRTDATPAFVHMLRQDGHEARLLDIRRDDLGGPHRAIVAMATLLHLSRPDFVRFLARAGAAAAPGGLLAFTLKEGDGEGWSTAKLGLPRYFVYWREAALRAALDASGWEVVSLDHLMGRVEPWLFVISRRSRALVP